ncbi:MAG: hypothetical protein HS111_11575 [Kofleriaceae bacterium]|nr:hypothetical protein [Kofleriaceae bacterium]MCL4227643.1 hypothetical protein [Myxococcales bacterium]
MSRRGLARLLVPLALLVAACTAPKSKVCRETCTREADCHESSSEEDSTFDEGECIAACAALERDDQTRGLVTRHAECVARAQSCREVLECK